MHNEILEAMTQYADVSGITVANLPIEPGMHEWFANGSQRSDLSKTDAVNIATCLGAVRYMAARHGFQAYGSDEQLTMMHEFPPLRSLQASQCRPRRLALDPRIYGLMKYTQDEYGVAQRDIIHNGALALGTLALAQDMRLVVVGPARLFGAQPQCLAIRNSDKIAGFGQC